MFRTVVVLSALTLLGAVLAPLPARAETCQALANFVVKDAVEDILKQVLSDHPNLKDLSQEELVATAGDKLLAAERPDFKAYGYMMLLWYGDEAARQTVADSAAALQTPEERAHFYFVMGLGKIRSDNPEVASQGRDYIRQMRDSGHVTFVNDALWDQLITDCHISE